MTAITHAGRFTENSKSPIEPLSPGFGRRRQALIITWMMIVGTGGAHAQSADGPMEEIVVRGSTQEFKPEQGSLSTKIDLPLVTTPQSVTVLSDEFLNVTNTRNISELANNVAGLQATGSGNGFDFRFTVRGFPLQRANGIRVNGIVVPTNTTLDFGAVESVEVVRGPSSSVLGQADFGGTINLTLKQPLEEWASTVGVQVGEHSLLRFDGDTGGPLTDDGRLRFRLAGGYEDTASFKDIEDTRLAYALASVGYWLSPETEVRATLYAQDREGHSDNGIALFPDGSIPDFDETDFFAPEWSRFATENQYFRLDIEHNWTDNLYSRLIGGTLDQERSFNTAIAGLNISSNDTIPSGTQPDGTSVLIKNNDEIQTRDNVFVEAQFGGDFQIGDRKQEFLLFGEYRDRETSEIDIGFFPFIDVFNVFTPEQIHSLPEPVFERNTLDEIDQELYSMSAVAILRPLDRVTLMLGARKEWIEDTAFGSLDDASGGGTAVVRRDTEEFVPRAGITYNLLSDGDFVDTLNVYYNWSEGFIGNFGERADGSRVENETGTQNEIGIKGDFLGGRLGVYAAYFDIERENVEDDDPLNPDFSISIDGQNHSGFELELIGEPVPGWNISASFASLDVKIEDTRLGSEDRGGVADTTASLFSTYEFLDGPFQGFSLGGGVYYVGERAITNGGVGKFPSYSRVDLRASYLASDRLRVTLQGKNLLDDEIFQNPFNNALFGTERVEARQIILSATYQFAD